MRHFLHNRIFKYRATWIALVFSVIVVLALVVRNDQNRESHLQEITNRGTLTFLTLNSPTTYYEDRRGHLGGLEYELATAFADSLGVKAEFKVHHSLNRLFQSLEQEPDAIAAAGLTGSKARSARFRLGAPYQEITQQVVCHRGVSLDSWKDLGSVDLIVTAGSTYVDRLEELSIQVPSLKWEARDNTSTEQILYQVWKREADCAIADSNIVSINQRYFPELVIKSELPGEQQLKWIFAKGSHSLAEITSDWFDEIQESGELGELLNRYYGFIHEFDYFDTKVFHRRASKRLPQYVNHFKRASENYGAPWTLLAAMAYQESHWNPLAKSPTGVRGMMMLTRITAEEVKVDNRLNARESIFGGARYFRNLHRRIAEEIDLPERNWFTLAAYNVGMGHLRDAQLLAKRLGKDPHHWEDVRETLPLLTQKKYFSTVPHGYARGLEPVRYVKRIRHYRDMLEQRFSRKIAAE